MGEYDPAGRGSVVASLSALTLFLLQQTTEMWFSHTWIVIAAIYIAALDAGAVWVLTLGIWHWRKLLAAHEARAFAGAMPDFNTTVIIASVVVAVLNVILLGAMNVGQAFGMATDGAEALAWLVGAVLVPLIGGKTITKFASSKYGTADVQPPEAKP